MEDEFKEFNIPAVDETGKELTGKARKKLLAKAKKEARKASNMQKQEKEAAATKQVDWSEGKYGERVIDSSSRPGRTYSKISELSRDLVGKEVLVRARIHTTRNKGRLAFFVLRQRYSTVQCVCQQAQSAASKQMFKFLCNVPPESVIDLVGEVRAVEEEISSCTQHDLELGVKELFVVSRSEPKLPIQLEDAERPRPLIKEQKANIKALDAEIEAAKAELEVAEGDDAKAAVQTKLDELATKKGAAQKFVVLSRNERLNNRVVDLRTITNQAIFSVQSGVCALFREYLMERDFVEIHTPKLLGVKSEGGANVFSLQYFGRDAYLAQSPQLYKQMSISSDLNRVFEIAPVFRAENANTYRHMTEFIGLDMEMAFNEHYHEVLDTIEQLFVHIFKGLATRYRTQLDVIKRQYPFEELVPTLPDGSVLRLQWPDIVKLLRENGLDTLTEDGHAMGDFEDVNTTQEKELGKVVKKKYGVDFYVVDKFPLSIRPFYTMPDPVDPRYSNSYDIFIRGQEVLSGAQRIHDPELLLKRCADNSHGPVDPATIKDYVDAFRFGAWPHAGGGIGMERVVMLFLDLHNIRDTCMFPRTPNRLAP